MNNNKSLTYSELDDLRGSKVWDSRDLCWVIILNSGDCCIQYKDEYNSIGEIYRGDEEGRFFIEQIKR